MNFNIGKKSPPSIDIGKPIFIDLMPKSHKEVVYLAKIQRVWFYGVVLFIALCLAVTAGMYLKSAQTSTALNNETEVQQEIDVSILEYAEVNQALESQKAALKLLNGAAGYEVDWKKLINKAQSSLPSETKVSSLGATAISDDKKDSAAVSVRVDLISNDTLGYADTLKAFEALGGVSNINISGLSSGKEGSYEYSVVFTLDKNILTDRFTIKESK